MNFISVAAFLLAFSPGVSASNHCCDALESAGLSSRLYYPGQDAYTARVDSYFSLAARLNPHCILQPHNAVEVSKAIVALVKANETQACQFAIRSGGNTNFAGAANIVDGVTIDLGLMNSTTYFPNNQTAAVLPGARWKSVYETMDKVGMAIAGGRAGGVGVGGLTLGGGNSFYSARRGMVCDAVANFEVVLANGSIINADSEGHSDLFQTLKGGSNNFGIVTRFDFHAFVGGDNAPNNLWGGVVSYPHSTTDQQLKALVNFGNNIDNDPYASTIAFWRYSSVTNQTIILNCYEYTKPEPRPAIFEEFLAIPGNTSDSMRISNITDLVAELAQEEGFRNTFLTLTFKHDLRVLTKSIELHDAFVKKIGVSAQGHWNMNTLLHLLPTAFGKRGAEKGGNMLGFDRYDENLAFVQVYLSWSGSEQDDHFQSHGDAFIAQLSEYTKSIGQDNPFIYLPYAGKHDKPLEGYGAVNVNKMRAAAKKYDPTGVFQTMVPGGFKISKF